MNDGISEQKILHFDAIYSVTLGEICYWNLLLVVLLMKNIMMTSHERM